MESTCLVLFLFTITHTAQALIVPLPGLSISSKHFLTLLKYQENLILLNIPGRSDRGVSADVADCGSNHILCTSQVFVEEQPRNEILFRMEETIVVTTATPAAVNLGRTAVQ